MRVSEDASKRTHEINVLYSAKIRYGPVKKKKLKKKLKTQIKMIIIVTLLLIEHMQQGNCLCYIESKECAMLWVSVSASQTDGKWSYKSMYMILTKDLKH